jgi:DNA mismatch repair protein MutS2
VNVPCADVLATDAAFAAAPSADLQSLRDLEWERVLGALAARSVTAMGKRAALTLAALPNETKMRQRHSIARATCALYAAGARLPVRECTDINDAVVRLRSQGLLSGVELRAIAIVVSMAATLRRFFAQRAAPENELGSVADFEALKRALSAGTDADEIAETVKRAVEADGRIADAASPELRALRQELSVEKSRMQKRMEAVMAEYANALQDTFITEREGRYVLPVRSDSHERFTGIVHASSGSGGTLFVEPSVVVALGNRLKVLSADVAAAEEAVARALSAQLRTVLASIGQCAEAVALADLLAATAQLRQDCNLEFPELCDGAVLELRDAKHFLLMLDRFEPPRHTLGSEPAHHAPADVVGSALSARAGSAWVISGPNTGGKTVAMKALGLAAWMVRSGLPIAAAAGSRVGFWRNLFTAIGDTQSIAANLSTFAAHMTRIAEILANAGASTLVLLDELCGGTDPKEGEALARGILESLCARGAATVVTTHFEGLALLSSTSPQFRAASMGFDVGRGKPNFRVLEGVPGRSRALAAAAEYGLPQEVIDTALRHLPTASHKLDQVIEQLQREHQRLEDAVAAAHEATIQAKSVASTLEKERRSLEELGYRRASR